MPTGTEPFQPPTPSTKLRPVVAAMIEYAIFGLIFTLTLLAIAWLSQL